MESDVEYEPDIEEIDKWIASLPSDPAGAVMDAFKVRKAKRAHVRRMLEAYGRSLSAAPVHGGQTPVAWLVVGEEHRRLQWSPEVADDDAPLVTVIPLVPAVADMVSRDQEVERLREALRQMLRAIDAGSIDSEQLPGDMDSGIAPYKWHEEWAYHARAALGDAP